jgi:hypothetical protein
MPTVISPEGTAPQRAARRGAGSCLPVACTVATLALSACGADETASSAPSLTVLSLSDAPTLQIGVLEGDPDYLFQDIASTLRLPSGQIAVSDAGALEVSVYSAEGTFLRRWGGRGEGPGEFRGLSRIYSGGNGSILALDAWTGRISVFDTLGEFSHQVVATELTGDTLFSLDVWLHGRFWVDGALHPQDRDDVRAVLDALPSPPAGEHRVVRVARDGRLWIREPVVSPTGMRTWTVVTASGNPEALVALPIRFEPQEVSEREVVGRWLGRDDANFVRSYSVAATDSAAAPPGWLNPTEPPAPVAAPVDEETMAQVRQAIMRMASAQEIHYSTHSTYTALVDSLSWERPEDIGVDIVTGDARGWAGVFTHPGLDRICGLGYGAAVPPGWLPGSIMCGPPSKSTAPEGS